MSRRDGPVPRVGAKVFVPHHDPLKSRWAKVLHVQHVPSRPAAIWLVDIEAANGPMRRWIHREWVPGTRAELGHSNNYWCVWSK